MLVHGSHRYRSARSSVPDNHYVRQRPRHWSPGPYQPCNPLLLPLPRNPLRPGLLLSLLSLPLSLPLRQRERAQRERQQQP